MVIFHSCVSVYQRIIRGTSTSKNCGCSKCFGKKKTGSTLKYFGDPKLISVSIILSRFQLFDFGFLCMVGVCFLEVDWRRACCDSPVDQLQFGEQTITWLVLGHPRSVLPHLFCSFRKCSEAWCPINFVIYAEPFRNMISWNLNSGNF